MPIQPTTTTTTTTPAGTSPGAPSRGLNEPRVVHLHRAREEPEPIADRASPQSAQGSRLHPAENADPSAVAREESAKEQWLSAASALCAADEDLPARNMQGILEAAERFATYVDALRQRGSELDREEIPGWLQLRSRVSEMLLPPGQSIDVARYRHLLDLQDAMAAFEAARAVGRPDESALLLPGRIPLGALKRSDLAQIADALGKLGFAHAALVVLNELRNVADDFSSAMNLLANVALKDMDDKQFLRIRISAKRAEFSQAPEMSVDAEERLRCAAEARQEHDRFVQLADEVLAAQESTNVLEAAAQAGGALNRHLSLQRNLPVQLPTQASHVMLGKIDAVQRALTSLLEAGTLSLGHLQDWKLKNLLTIASGNVLNKIHEERNHILQVWEATCGVIAQDAGLRNMEDADLRAALDVFERKDDLAHKLEVMTEIRARERIQSLASAFIAVAGEAFMEGRDAASYLRNVSEAAERFAYYREYAVNEGFPISVEVSTACDVLRTEIDGLLASTPLSHSQLDLLVSDCDVLGFAQLQERVRGERQELDRNFETAVALVQGRGPHALDDDELARVARIFDRYERSNSVLARSVRSEIEARRNTSP